MTAIRCSRSGCGVVMRDHVDAIGRLTHACPACARNKRGVCRDCPRPLTNKRAFRCEPCRVSATLKRGAAYKRRLRKDPVAYANMLELSRRWNKTPKGKASIRAASARHRAKHPRVYTEADRQYQRDWSQRNRLNDAYRRKRNKRDRLRWHRDAEWAESRREACRARRRAVVLRTAPERRDQR